jgi:hypothetical protein
VINSVRTAGIETVGELRGWTDVDLLELRSLGKVSLNQVHAFFALCDRIETGRQEFQSIEKVLEIFLDDSQRVVITARYGLRQSDPRASRNWITLQEIGNQQDKTRERIRQIEDLAKQRLTSRLATECLEPFYRHFEDFIRRRASVISFDALGAMREEEGLAGFNPAGILLLLSDLDSQRIAYHNGLFSVLPISKIREIEEAARRVLERHRAPVSAQVLCSELEPIDEGLDPADLPRAVPLILDHTSGLGATFDERYFLYSSSVHPFLAEIMEEASGPVHYRQVAARFNERVKPRSRRGAGYILESLNKSPNFERTDRGMYALRRPLEAREETR